MNKELYDEIIAFNRQRKEDKEFAEDLKFILEELKKLPYGQIKKLLSQELISIFEKYGVT